MRARRAWMPTTGDTLRRHARLTSIALHSHPLPPSVLPATSPVRPGSTIPGATLHFLNCTPASPGRVLLYLHGGGYCYATALGATGGGHATLAEEMALNLHVPNVVLLEYDLAPELQYPGQLVQAISALRFLLQAHGADELVVAGDSAGGNLALGLLLHAAAPSPYADAVALRGQRLRAAALVSPWVGLTRATPSYRRNKTRDYIPASEGNAFLAAWGPRVEEGWADPLAWRAERVREALGGVVEEVLVTLGAWEVLCDDIVQLAGLLGAELDERKVMRGEGQVVRSKGVTAVCAREEGHCMPIMESFLQARRGEGRRGLDEWCERVGKEWV